MSWGYKILLVYGIFVAGILFMVFKSSSQKMDLVTTDYYEKELKYQEKIDESGRTNALSESVRYEVKGNQMRIHFPKDFAGKKITGIAELYCPSNQARDVTKEFAIQDTALQIVIPAINRGQYELHITWQAEGVSYYFEKKLFL
jgi:nitrogen fixation protein FixH